MRQERIGGNQFLPIHSYQGIAYYYMSFQDDEV